VSASRFFVEGIFDAGDGVALEPDDARKLRVVLRAATGDQIEVLDSAGRLFAATLRFDGERASALLDRELAAPQAPALRATLAQGVPKGQKMDFVVEKATELGVASIVPFWSTRTVGGAREGKVERWRRLAKTASAQCGRRDVPAVEEPVDFAALVERVRIFDVALVPWELAPRIPLRERIPALVERAVTILVVIGPEGGLTESEARMLEAAGAHLISLGSRILRTETAGLVTLAALLYAGGDL
jgi:16S rRNA (uracil1498-N3)-methyltransferase